VSKRKREKLETIPVDRFLRDDGKRVMDLLQQQLDQAYKDMMEKRKYTYVEFPASDRLPDITPLMGWTTPVHVASDIVIPPRILLVDSLLAQPYLHLAVNAPLCLWHEFAAAWRAAKLYSTTHRGSKDDHAYYATRCWRAFLPADHPHRLTGVYDAGSWYYGVESSMYVEKPYGGHEYPLVAPVSEETPEPPKPTLSPEEQAVEDMFAAERSKLVET
jgi:hypothetical protein